MGDGAGDGRERWDEVRAAARHSGLSDAEFRIWMLLRTYEGRDGAFPKAATLAEHLDKSPRTVRRHRSQLVEKGFVTRDLRGPKPASFRTTVPGAPESDGGEGNEYPAPSDAVGGNYPDEFEAAWSAYPDREGSNSKKAGYRKWLATVRNGADPEELLAATRIYARRMERDGKVGGRFVKQTRTFFGPDDYWRDELENGRPQADGGTDLDRQRAALDVLDGGNDGE